jgi:hypothetical protein
MSPLRRSLLVALAATLGIALAAAITWGTSQLVSQRIGLASEPLTAGRRLLAPAAPTGQVGTGSATTPASNTNSPSKTQSSPAPSRAASSPPASPSSAPPRSELPSTRSSGPPVSSVPAGPPIESVPPIVRRSGGESTSSDSTSHRDD